MDARSLRGLGAVALALLSLGANYRSSNFVVSAPSQQIAEQVGRAAEKYRHDLAVEWLGQPMPNWSRPCPVQVQIDPRLGAGGVTSFVFDQGEVFGWQMNIQGPLDRVLDSVLPHEVTHTVFATHFRRPLPRWADEGACTTVEHDSERYKQQKLLVQFLQSNRGIPFSQMFVMKEYPRDILPLYAQGHSLSTYLMYQGGKHKFLSFVGEGLDTEDWIVTTKKYYGYESLAELQDRWLDWVRSGSPRLSSPGGDTVLASNNSGTGPRVLRGQSPDHPAPGQLARNEPAVAAPLVPIQRPGAIPAGALQEPASLSPSTAQLASLPGPAAGLQARQAAVPPIGADGSVYAVRPRPGDTLLR